MKVWIFSKRFLMLFIELSMVLQTFNSPLGYLVSCHHRSTLYLTERLSLMLVFPGCLLYETMLLYGAYISERIHKGGKLMLFLLTGKFTT